MLHINYQKTTEGVLAVSRERVLGGGGVRLQRQQGCWCAVAETRSRVSWFGKGLGHVWACRSANVVMFIGSFEKNGASESKFSVKALKPSVRHARQLAVTRKGGFKLGFFRCLSLETLEHRDGFLRQFVAPQFPSTVVS